MRPVPAWMRNAATGDVIRSDMFQETAALLIERKLLPGRGVLLTEVPGVGTVVEAEAVAGSAFPHPWRTVRTGAAVSISPGLVNTRLPVIGGAPMDGLDEEGEPLPQGVPVLDLGDPSDAPYDENGYLWVCVRAAVDPETGTLREEPPFEMVLSDRLSWLDGGVLDIEGTGDYPVALIRRPRKQKDRHGRVFQICHFNLNHRFARDVDRPARHIFWV